MPASLQAQLDASPPPPLGPRTPVVPPSRDAMRSSAAGVSPAPLAAAVPRRRSVVQPELLEDAVTQPQDSFEQRLVKTRSQLLPAPAPRLQVLTYTQPRHNPHHTQHCFSDVAGLGDSSPQRPVQPARANGIRCPSRA